MAEKRMLVKPVPRFKGVCIQSFWADGSASGQMENLSSYSVIVCCCRVVLIGRCESITRASIGAIDYLTCLISLHGRGGSDTGRHHYEIRREKGTALSP